MRGLPFTLGLLLVALMAVGRDSGPGRIRGGAAGVRGQLDRPSPAPP